MLNSAQLTQIKIVVGAPGGTEISVRVDQQNRHFTLWMPLVPATLLGTQGPSGPRGIDNAICPIDTTPLNFDLVFF